MHLDPVNMRILEAAEAEFASHGFHQAVVSQIADRAGVGKGTVYRRFGDKKALFTCLITQGMSTLRGNVDSAFQRKDPPRQALEGILGVYFDFFDQARDLIAITLLEGVSMAGSIHEQVKVDVEYVLGRFQELFLQGMEQGDFRVLDPERSAFLFHEFIWSVMRGAVFFGFNPRQEYGEAMLDLFFNGICAQRQTPREKEEV